MNEPPIDVAGSVVPGPTKCDESLLGDARDWKITDNNQVTHVVRLPFSVWHINHNFDVRANDAMYNWPPGRWPAPLEPGYAYSIQTASAYCYWTPKPGSATANIHHHRFLTYFGVVRHSYQYVDHLSSGAPSGGNATCETYTITISGYNALGQFVSWTGQAEVCT